jgi:hypothetical protein
MPPNKISIIESFAIGYKATADQQKNLIVANGRLGFKLLKGINNVQTYSTFIALISIIAFYLLNEMRSK